MRYEPHTAAAIEAGLPLASVTAYASTRSAMIERGLSPAAAEDLAASVYIRKRGQAIARGAAYRAVEELFKAASELEQPTAFVSTLWLAGYRTADAVRAAARSGELVVKAADRGTSRRSRPRPPRSRGGVDAE